MAVVPAHELLVIAAANFARGLEAPRQSENCVGPLGTRFGTTQSRDADCGPSDSRTWFGLIGDQCPCLFRGGVPVSSASLFGDRLEPSGFAI